MCLNVMWPLMKCFRVDTGVNWKPCSNNHVMKQLEFELAAVAETFLFSCKDWLYFVDQSQSLDHWLVSRSMLGSSIIDCSSNQYGPWISLDFLNQFRFPMSISVPISYLHVCCLFIHGLHACRSAIPTFVKLADVIQQSITAMNKLDLVFTRV